MSITHTARHVNAAATRCVAQGVGQQVGKQNAQGFGVTHDHRPAVDLGKPQIDVAGFGHPRLLDDGLARQRREFDSNRRHGHCARFESRQGKQLLHGVARPLQAALEFVERGAAFGIARRAFDELRLQLQRGQRRSQFVRSVRDEIPLGGEGGLEPRQ